MEGEVLQEGGEAKNKRGEGRTDGNEKYSKLGRSQTKTTEESKRREGNIARVEQREGYMLRLMDG